MTIEEQVAGLTENVKKLEAKLDEVSNGLISRDEQIDKLLENQKNQNSYITKLEQLTKEVKNQAPVKNQAYEKYVMNNWKNSVIQQGLDLAAQTYDKSHVDVMESEVSEYCMKHMADNNVTTDYVLSVFQLLYGRAMGNPEHQVHKLRINPNNVRRTDNPNPVTPNPPLHETLTPPTIRQEGVLPGNVPPAQPRTNIKQSYQGLEARLANIGNDQ